MFVRTSDVDRRAIEFHLRLREIEKMPLVHITVSKDGKKILLCNKQDPSVYAPMSVEDILLLDIEEAKAKGGTQKDLVMSRKAAKSRVTQAEVDEGVPGFLSGDDT